MNIKNYETSLLYNQYTNANIYSSLNFPIWEKVYSTADFLGKVPSNFKTVEYNRSLIIFPNGIGKEGVYRYFTFNYESESFNEYSLNWDCSFAAQDSTQHQIIYLFSYDSEQKKSQHIKVFEFNAQSNEVRFLKSNGSVPYYLNEEYVTWYRGEKVYYINYSSQKQCGSTGMKSIDFASLEIYSFCTITYEWNIEQSLNTSMTNTNNISKQDKQLGLSTNSYCLREVMQDKDTMLLIGFLENSSKLTKQTIQKAEKLSIDLYELSLMTYKLTKKEIKQSFSLESVERNQLKFNSSLYSKENNSILLHFNLATFIYDLVTSECFMVKRLIYHPTIPFPSSSVMFEYSQQIYILSSQFNHYEDCLAMKARSSLFTSQFKCDSIAMFQYSNLLNYKNSCDSLFHFSDESRQKDIYIDRRVISNFSSEVKLLLDENRKINKKGSLNEYYFSHTSPSGASNALLIIYYNFLESALGISPEIYDEIFSFLYQFKAVSVLSLITQAISVILNSQNCCQFLDLSMKYRNAKLSRICRKFIGDLDEKQKASLFGSSAKKLESFISLSADVLKKYFCSHSNTLISCELSKVQVLKYADENAKNQLFPILTGATTGDEDESYFSSKDNMIVARICMECFSIVPA